MISVAEVIRQARVNLLKDTDADDFQFNDKELLDAANNVAQQALKLKPILQWTDSHTYSDVSAFRASSVTDTLPFSEDVFEALVLGVCEKVCGSLQADQAMVAAQQRYKQGFIEQLKM